MNIDLKKVVNNWWLRHTGDLDLYTVLKAMATEIETNKEEIEKLKAKAEPSYTIEPDYEDVRALKVERDRQ